MIIRYVVLRLKHLAIAARKTESLLVSAVILMIALIYALLFSVLANKSAEGTIDFLSYDELLHYAFLVIIAFTFFRTILPAYVPLRQIFPQHYPLPLFKRYVMSLLKDILSSYFFYLTIVILAITVGLNYHSAYFLYTGIMALLSSHLLRRLIQYVVDFPLRKEGYAVFVVTLVVLAIMVMAGAGNTTIQPLIALSITVLLFFSGYFMETFIKGTIRTHAMNLSLKGMLHFKLLINNGKARSLLLIAFVFKIVLLVADIIHLNTEGVPLYERQIVVWIMASPAILFTYVFNNTWAFWPGLFRVVVCTDPRFRVAAYHQLKLLWIPLLLDMVLTFPVLWVTWGAPLMVSAVYIGSAILLAALSLFWSMSRPKSVHSTFQMKGTSSMLAAFVSMMLVMLTALIRLGVWYYLIVPLYIAGAIVVFRYSQTVFRSGKYSLFFFHRRS